MNMMSVVHIVKVTSSYMCHVVFTVKVDKYGKIWYSVNKQRQRLRGKNRREGGKDEKESIVAFGKYLHDDRYGSKTAHDFCPGGGVL